MNRIDTVRGESVDGRMPVRAVKNATPTFDPRPLGIFDWAKAIRAHQWIKNLLLFVPLVAAHQLARVDLVVLLVIALFAFNLCASAAYILNDLVDVVNDRCHPRKRQRVFASGRISKRWGVLLAALLSISSFACAAFIGSHFVAWLAIYFLITCAYSWKLKRIVLLDCATLAALYTIRIVAGASAADIKLSFWLIIFSIFLFFSLAFLKRFTELQAQEKLGRKFAPGRDYFTSDAALIQLFGVSSGYAAVLVMALYLNSENVIRLYQTPYLLWPDVPLTLLWVSWMWLKSHRGQMHDDPLIFALRDPISLVIGLLCMTAGVLATFVDGSVFSFLWEKV